MSRLRPPAPPRRQFLRRAATSTLALTAAPAWLAEVLAQSAQCLDDAPGELVRTLPLYGLGSDEVPLGRLLGTGLDARQYTDLSRLAPGTLVTPSPEVFIRTTAPPTLPDPKAWAITLRSADGATLATVPLAQLTASASDQGTHLLECAGNSNPWNFGLMSAAAFTGVALAPLIDRMQPAGGAAVLVTGHDHAVAASRRSLAGASWMLPLDAVASTGAFLATTMNGAPLTPDHGAPVRLVVPGWYGCAWIKWVHDLQWVARDARPTDQMLEFAFRTHQDGIPMQLDRYEEPVIDTAAMPIRVEERRVGSAREYRVVGLVWGGVRPVERLLIRFASRDAGAPVTLCASAPNRAPWALWTYRWRPAAPGPYDITLKVAAPAVRTRRLDLSHYIRRVHIDP